MTIMAKARLWHVRHVRRGGWYVLDGFILVCPKFQILRSRYRQNKFPDISVANYDEVLVKSKLLVVLSSSRLLLPLLLLL